MKRLFSGLVILCLLSTCLFAYAGTTSLKATKASFKVMVRGEVYVSETPPIVIEGRTYLPLRAMGGVLGVSVVWNAKLNQAEVGMTTDTSDNNTQTALSNAEKAIWKKASWKVTKPSFKVMVRGEEFKSEYPPIVVEGRTFLPLRALGDALGVSVVWNEKLKQAEVDMAKSATVPEATKPAALPATPTPTAVSTIAATATPTATSSSSSSSSSSSTYTNTQAPTATATHAATATPTATPTVAATPTEPIPTDSIHDQEEPTPTDSIHDQEEPTPTDSIHDQEEPTPTDSIHDQE